MSKRPRLPLTAWSASRIATYELCPARLYWPLLGYREPPRGPGDPMERGKVVHQAGEAYLKAPRAPRRVPASFNYFADDLRKLRQRKAVAEQGWAFTERWKPCEWMDPAVRVRMQIDAHVPGARVLTVVDFKTGRGFGREAHEAQCGLYAVGAFVHHPQIREVVARLWYLDLNDETELVYDAAAAKQAREQWEARAAPLLADRTLAPAPSRQACRAYGKPCPFGKSQGGPCEAEET